MARVIMTCGKICCGKTTYARKLEEELGAVVLSIDEVMLTLFPDGAREMHDTYALRTEQYLLSLSLKILESGTDVILDWGLWTRVQRDRLREFYRAHNFPCEIHYLRISDDEWQRRIRQRNVPGRKKSWICMSPGLEQDPAAARQLNPNRLKRRIAEKKKTRPDQQVSPAGLLCTAHPAARNWAATTQTTSAAVFWRQVSAWT